MRALCGVGPSWGPSLGSLVPFPTVPMTEFTRKLSNSPVSGLGRLNSSRANTSITWISMSLATSFVSARSVPIGLDTKMFKYCGWLSGKKSTFGGKVPIKTMDKNKSPTVPQKKAQGRLPPNT